jgi:hypothetical protein
MRGDSIKRLVVGYCLYLADGFIPRTVEPESGTARGIDRDLRAVLMSRPSEGWSTMPTYPAVA